MYKSRSGRVAFALIVVVALTAIGRNLYRRYLNNTLVAAIKADNVSAVMSLLDRGADPRYRFTDSPQTVLDLAMSRMENTAALAYGLRGEPQSGQMPFSNAVNPDGEAIVCLLIRKGAGSKDFPWNNYLITACQLGDVPVARAILDCNVGLKSDGERQNALFGVLYYANPYSTTGSSVRALTPIKKVEAARRAGISRQLAQLLCDHGLHLTLTNAEQLGDTAKVMEILNRSRTAWASDGYRALCLAVSKGDLELTRQLLDHGAEPNGPGPYMNPLSEAADAGNLAMVKLLLARGAKVNSPGITSPLMIAAWGGRAELVRLFLALGADPNAHPGSPQSALAVALRKVPAAVPDLLKHGANVNPAPDWNAINAIGDSPSSPLMNALWYAPQYESLLQRAGAKIGTDRSFICASAARQRRVDLLPKLLAYGADIDGKDCIGDTSLALCIEQAPDNVKFLLDHGANPNIASHSRAPLEQAAMIGNADVVRLLLAHGADINAHPDHHTALDWAQKKHHADIVDLLRRAGAKG